MLFNVWKVIWVEFRFERFLVLVLIVGSEIVFRCLVFVSWRYFLIYSWRCCWFVELIIMCMIYGVGRFFFVVIIVVFVKCCFGVMFCFVYLFFNWMLLILVIVWFRVLVLYMFSLGLMMFIMVLVDFCVKLFWIIFIVLWCFFFLKFFCKVLFFSLKVLIIFWFLWNRIKWMLVIRDCGLFW